MQLLKTDIINHHYSMALDENFHTDRLDQFVRNLSITNEWNDKISLKSIRDLRTNMVTVTELGLQVKYVIISKVSM